MDLVTSEFYGNCLILLRLGEYKVINFKEEAVTTVFPKNISRPDVDQTIHKCIKAQKCDLAPKIISWNASGRFITERYLNVNTLSFGRDNPSKFYLEVFPILGNVLISTTPEKVLSRKYVQKLLGKIDYIIKTSLNQNNNNDEKIVQEFLLLIKEELKVRLGEEIQLVFSHGDFWEQNILKGKKKFGVIDWNTLDMRSFYFDFYYIMFHKVSRENEGQRAKSIKEIETAFTDFQIFLKENKQFNSKILLSNKSQSELYRYLFYLEIILLRLQEFIRRGKKDLDFLISWIIYSDCMK